LQIPLILSGCRRGRPTPPQLTLDRSERASNVRSAFHVELPTQLNHVAIIDDVITTGSTVRALAYQLKRAGAARITVWACARA